MSGGEPVAVEGTELPLWGLEIDPERARDAFRAFAGKDNGQARAARPRAVHTCAPRQAAAARSPPARRRRGAYCAAGARARC